MKIKKMLPDMWFTSVVQNAISKDLKGTKRENVSFIHLRLLFSPQKSFEVKTHYQTTELGTRVGVLDLWSIAPLLYSMKGLGIDNSTRVGLDQWTAEYLEFHDASPLAINEGKSKVSHKHMLSSGAEFDILTTYQSRHPLRHAISQSSGFHQQRQHHSALLKNDRHSSSYFTCPDGWEPTARALTGDSVFYSVFCMRAWAFVALFAEEYGVNMWDVRPEGTNIFLREWLIMLQV